MSPKNAIPSIDAAISSRVFLLWWTPRSMTARRARTMRRAEIPPPKIEASEKFLALLLTMLEVLMMLLPPPPLLPMVLPTVLLDGLGLGDTTGHEPKPYPMQVFPDVLYATYMLFHSWRGMERNTHNSNWQTRFTRLNGFIYIRDIQQGKGRALDLGTFKRRTLWRSQSDGKHLE